ncbi:hypothetical protein Pla123a_20210 [Posidoniimonas polymericola]|uniref:Uncharacterized protein n=1 Tax=Posidoniimonas polymericola TaxID=2528002 RepID=A0A5C5YRK7_9BACT|nr:hypothetical protein Pla123a_20210 [Posidoniimonas polymericola]
MIVIVGPLVVACGFIHYQFLAEGFDYSPAGPDSEVLAELTSPASIWMAPALLVIAAGTLLLAGGVIMWLIQQIRGA